MRTIGKLLRDTRGASAIEYAVVASLISVAALSAFANVGHQVQSKFQNVNDHVARAL